MPDPTDRLAIPSSSLTDADNVRNQQYDDEARKQDLGDADDFAREKYEADVPEESQARQPRRRARERQSP